MKRHRGARWIWAAAAAALAIGACEGAGAPSTMLPPGSTTSPASSLGSSGESFTPSTRPVASTGDSPSAAPILGVVDVARLASGETPADWVEIESDDGGCRQAVPFDWIESGIPGQILSPEVQATAALTNNSIDSWPDYVEHLQATYFTDGQEVLVETARMFLLRSTERGGASHVLALNGGATACSVLLAIDEAGIDQYAATGVQILYTLAVLR